MNNKDQESKQSRKRLLGDEWVTDFHYDIDTASKQPQQQQKRLPTNVNPPTLTDQVTEVASTVYDTLEFQTRHGRQYVYQKYNEFYYSNHSCTIL
jgi:hypothetical protein